MSQLKSTAGERQARRANGSVLLRNCTKAVLPAATGNNSVVFSRNEQVRAKTVCRRGKRMDVVDEHHCSCRAGCWENTSLAYKQCYNGIICCAASNVELGFVFPQLHS